MLVEPRGLLMTADCTDRPASAHMYAYLAPTPLMNASRVMDP
jgi:hypothetical protein